MAKTWTIYLLRHQAIGYVGQTIRTPEHRLRTHLSEARRGGSTKAVHRWLAGLAVDPELVVIQRCTSLDEANAAELLWMRWARKGFGLVLMNRRKGGQHGYDAEVHGEAMKMAWQAATPAQRRRRSDNSKRIAAGRDRKTWEAQIHTAASRLARSEKAKARWADPAFKARVGAAIAKAYASPEARAKMAERAREVNARPEVKAKVDAHRIALWRDPVSRAKRCASLSAARRRGGG
jgi:hypothetical protein